MSAPHTPVVLVDDLETARRFYVHTLGCVPFETSAEHVALELHGHPLTLRVAGASGTAAANDDRAVEVVTGEIAFLLGVDDWCTLSERLRAHDVDVAVEPGRRFSAVPGEQCAMRLLDPEDNPIALLGFAREADQLAA